MLGKDLKKLIKLYEDIIYDTDKLPELLSLDEEILSEMLIDEEESNFLDMEKLAILFDIATNCNYDASFKKRVIKSLKDESLSKVETINESLEGLYDIYGTRAAEYVEYMVKANLSLEDFGLLFSYIDEQVSYDSKEDISLDFLRNSNPCYLSTIIKIKNEMASYASEKMRLVERIINAVIRYNKDDVDSVSEYVIVLNYLLEKIEIFDFDYNFDNSTDSDEKEKELFEFIEGLVFEMEISIQNMDTLRFTSLIDFLELLDLSELNVAKKTIYLIMSLDGNKINRINKIYKNMGLVIDLEEDYEFIEKLSELEDEQLEHVEVFTKKYCAECDEPYDTMYLYTNPKIIERYDEIAKILRSHGNRVDNLFNIDGNLENKIECAIDDEEGLDEVLALIPDEEDIPVATLKFTFPKKKK